MIITTYKFRLYPTKEQQQLLKQHAGNTRFMWNQLVNYINEHNKETKKLPNRKKLQEKIIEIKQQHEFLQLSHSQPLQINALRLSRTITQAFKPAMKKERAQKIAIALQETDIDKRNKKLAKAYKHGFPKFHKKSDNSDSIYYPQNVKIKKCKVFLPKLGWFNFKKHRTIEGEVKTVDVIQDGNQWYICITCYIDKEPPPLVPLDTADIVGVDLNMRTNFATISDGEVIDNPKFLKKSLEKIRIESEKLSRKKKVEVTLPDGRKVKKYSKRGDKQCLKLHKAHRKVRNQRQNYLHQKSHHVTTKHDGAVFETLSVKDMMTGNISAINRAIGDVSWYAFVRMVEYKCQRYGKYFVQIDRYLPSTQMCNKCKHTMVLSIDQREYVCEHCGNVDGRDDNSSKNVRDEGIKVLKVKYGSTVGTTGKDAQELTENST